MNEKRIYLEESSLRNHDMNFQNDRLLPLSNATTDLVQHVEVGPRKPWRPLLRPVQYCILILVLLYLSSKIRWHKSPNLANETTLFPQMSLNPPSMQPIVQSYEHCHTTSASKTHQFEFNITAESSTTEIWQKRWQLLDSAVPESRNILRGGIKIVRGSSSQPSDIEVRAVVNSSDEMDLENLIFQKGDSVLLMDYLFEDRTDVCTEVQLHIFLRPDPEQSLDLFNIRTNILDIWFDYMLNWEINNLNAHTSHGEITINNSPYDDPLMAHNVSLSSVDGTMFGWYVPYGNFELLNIHGSVYGYLCGNWGSGKPFNPESFSVSTLSGDIELRTYVDLWPPEPSTHRINIRTVSGNIITGVPHGQYTNFSSISGNISTNVKPFSPDDTTEIYTTSQSGNIDVWLMEPPEEILEQYNPLLKAVSEHKVVEGKLDLRYPFSWYGDMEGKIEHGALKFDGSWIEELKQNEGYVKAKRGTKGKSHMEAGVGTGALNILLGL